MPSPVPPPPPPPPGDCRPQLLESVWRSILENFRPIAVWGTDLALFYWVTRGAFGEAWLGAASWLQV